MNHPRKRPLPPDLRRMVALIDSAAVIASSCYDDLPALARPGLLALGGVLAELRLKVLANYREPGLKAGKCSTGNKLPGLEGSRTDENAPPC